MPDYMLRGGDGYDDVRDQQVLVGPEAGPLMVDGAGEVRRRREVDRSSRAGSRSR